ncbi:MAG: hypothetical protein J07HX64_02158 [halophilic archaeon J07HX64]|nr:MAG: hypothetical protein J07HX64_02158 [halophilic archaeon J07HX64]
MGSGGYAVSEWCLTVHLFEGDEPVHLEACNASFEDSVTQRLDGALVRDSYEGLPDPRGCVCVWSQRSKEVFGTLRTGEYVFPTLPETLGVLGPDEVAAREVAAAVEQLHDRRQGTTVRGNVA